MPSGLDVGSLRLIRAIADAGSITAAAASLGYTQPAVSQHVTRLERRLGTALLERHPRGVRLTEAGRVLARYGGTVSASLDAAQREVSALAGLSSGRVRLVSFPSAAATLVPAALVQLREEAPGVEVAFTEAEPPQSILSLREGRSDVVLAFDYPSSTEPTEPHLTGLHRRRLLSDPCVLAVADDDPRAERRQLHLRDLVGERWITGCPRCRGHLMASCAAAGFTPHIVFETDDYVATLAFVAAGLGVALLPGLVSPVAARHPGVRVRSVGGASRRSVFALTTPDLLRVPAVAATIDALADAATGH
jgi:DNA-binding transcriptional LysR family regulator